MDPPKTPGEMEWQVKQREYEVKKARAKALKLRLTCSICSEKAKLNCPCGTTQYCSTECQRIDWRDRGHRKACKKIRNERAAEAARAEAPTPPSPPPKEVVYGPAPRSHADEIRARIAAEHEAARARREAEPEPEMMSARFGSRCPICLEEWDVNVANALLACCCVKVCSSCMEKIRNTTTCALCRAPRTRNDKEYLVLLRRHVENEVPEAIHRLGDAYLRGHWGLTKSSKKAAKIYKRAVALGSVPSMCDLASMYRTGDGVKLDKKKATQLYRLAVDKGNSAFARHWLANTFHEERNYEEAFRLYKRAAEQGYAPSKYNVATYFFNGMLTRGECDRDEAIRWLESAAAVGNEDAIDALARIKSGEI